MSKDSSLPISFHTNSFPRIIVLLVDKNADNNYPKHIFHKVTAESKPLWAELPMSIEHAHRGAYGPSGPPHGYVPASACGSLFGEDCNNENEPNNRETCLSIHLVKIYMILAIQIT